MSPAVARARTITLTGRRPVRIHTDEWPVVGQGSVTFTWLDHSAKLTIWVRRTESGRVIVYARAERTDAKQPTAADVIWRGGVMLDHERQPWSAVVGAVIEVGREAARNVQGLRPEIAQQAASQCMAALPPEEV